MVLGFGVLSFGLSLYSDNKHWTFSFILQAPKSSEALICPNFQTEKSLSPSFLIEGRKRRSLNPKRINIGASIIATLFF